MDSLTLPESTPPLDEQIAEWIRRYPDATEVELTKPPTTVNVVPLLPNDETAVMIKAGLSLENTRLVSPVPLSTRLVEVTMRSPRTARARFPPKLKVHVHMVGLAFGSTDYKLQARTVERLILCLRPRRFWPHFSLTGLHVLASRVQRGKCLRTLGFDPRRDGITHLTSLQHPPVLSVWDASYTEDGEWSADLRTVALHADAGGHAPPLECDSAVPMDAEPDWA